MVTINNNWIIVSNDDISFLPLSIELSKKQKDKVMVYKGGRKVKQPQPNFYYYTIKDENMYIPIGLYNYICEYLKNSTIKDNRADAPWDVSDIINNLESYRDILGTVSLRDEQLISLRKALLFNRGILQLPTGAGKTEVMCAIVCTIDKLYGKCPTTLILEPTLNLVNSTVERFEKYSIPVCKYSDNRKIVNGKVNICHPSSLCNDIEKDSNLLNDVMILIGDECHHFSAEQFRNPTYSMSNLCMSIGVSASVISQEHINYTDIKDFDIKEALAISATGKLLINVVTGSMIDNNKLANPVLFMLDHTYENELDEKDKSDWHKIIDLRLCSYERNHKICECAKFFNSVGRKTLILVNTIKWSRMLLEMLYDMGIECGASYGSGKFEIFDGNDFINTENLIENFSNGEINVLIGTTHLYEGADIPNLDVIVLGFAGKGERTQIQGIGRALRLTKSGKYAYIVDFTDHNDAILFNHTQLRFKRYKDIIGIPNDRIFYRLDISKIGEIFSKLES